MPARTHEASGKHEDSNASSSGMPALFKDLDLSRYFPVSEKQAVKRQEDGRGPASTAMGSRKELYDQC